ncbi:MAG: hypothetical protein ACRDOU_01575 [Streptosporangiaceae bacterium]
MNVHGLAGAFWPAKADGRPWGNVKEARDQTQDARHATLVEAGFRAFGWRRPPGG